MSQIIVGKVRTSHGVKGDLKVFSTSGEYDHYSDFKSVTLKKGNRSNPLVPPSIIEIDGSKA